MFMAPCLSEQLALCEENKESKISQRYPKSKHPRKIQNKGARPEFTATHNPHLPRTNFFVRGYWIFKVSANTRKHPEERRAVRVLLGNKSQQAHHGAAATPIPAENDLQTPENAPNVCGKRTHRSPSVGFAVPQRPRAPGMWQPDRRPPGSYVPAPEHVVSPH